MRVWKFHGPTCSSFTLWACLHRALPIAEYLWKCSVPPSPVYHRCGIEHHTPLHLLRDCIASKPVWNILLRDANFFGAVDVVWWICCNINMSSSSFPFWNYIFWQIVHLFWTNHNSRRHWAVSFLQDPYALSGRILRMVLELLPVQNKETA